MAGYLFPTEILFKEREKALVSLEDPESLGMLSKK